MLTQVGGGKEGDSGERMVGGGGFLKKFLNLFFSL